MHPNGQNPVRPVALQGQAELQQLLELMRAQQQQQQSNRSAFSSLGPSQQAPILPEFSLYHAAHLSGLLGNNPAANLQANLGATTSMPGQSDSSIAGVQPLNQIAQLQQLHSLQNQGGLLQQGNAANEPSSSRPVPARAASRNEKSSTAYASRHQAAEQRRRNRINDRLDLLRKVVPHSERANTATFLEEVIKYLEDLQTRITALETAQGLPLSCPPRQGVREALNELTQPSQKILNVGGAASAPVLSGISQPVTIFPESHINTSNAAQSTLHKDRPETPSQSTGEVEGKGQEIQQPQMADEENDPASKRQKLAKSEPA